jgi:hypothetical protein
MPRKKPKPETITITAALSADTVRMIEDLTPPGRTAADSLEELLLLSVSHEHALKCAAPRKIYRIPRPVSDEESAAVQAAAAPMIERLLAAHREEAVACGLLAAGLALCTRLCHEAGYVHAGQHGAALAGDILQSLEAKAAALWHAAQEGNQTPP